MCIFTRYLETQESLIKFSGFFILSWLSISDVKEEIGKTKSVFSAYVLDGQGGIGNGKFRTSKAIFSK